MLSRIRYLPVVFLVSFVALYTINASSFWIDNAHHDVIRHFANTSAGKVCAQDPQHHWLKVSLSRPVSAALECLIFKNTFVQSDLTLWRFLVISILGLVNTLLFVTLRNNSVKLVDSIFILAPIMLLPGMLNSIVMVNLSNSITLLLSFVSFIMFHEWLRKNIGYPSSQKVNVKYSGAAIPFFILLATMFTYPAQSFFFFMGTLITLLNKQISNREALWKSLIHVAFFLSVSLSAILIRSFVFKDGGVLPNEFQMDLNVTNIIHRMLGSIPYDYIPSTFTLWFIESSALKISIFVYFALSLIGISKSFQGLPKKASLVTSLMESRIARLLMIIGIVLLSFVPTVIKGGGAQPFFRILLVPMAEISLIMLTYASLTRPIFLPLVFKNELVRMIQSCFLYAAVTTIILYSGYHIVKNTWNINQETSFARNALAGHQGEIKYIHVIKAIDNSIGFDGIHSYQDEFHRKTTDFSQDIFFFVKSAYESVYQEDKSLIFCNRDSSCEFKAKNDPKLILVSLSEHHERFCYNPDMLIIDFNILIKATGTGDPEIVNIYDVPPCNPEVA